MTIAYLGLDIASAPAAQGALDIAKLVPAAQKAERAVDSMAASINRDLLDVSKQGFARLSAAAEASLDVLREMEKARLANLPDSAKQAATAFERLKASIDPAYAAELKLAQAQNTVNAALKAGKINADEAAATMLRFSQAHVGVVNNAGRMRGSIQNTSFQLQDLAVQMQMGTSASIALGQQLPQLLSGFGAVGAVVGLAAAVGIPLLASAFGSAAGEAEELEDRLERLADAGDRLVDANDRLSQSNWDLIDRYGRFADSVREIIELDAQLARSAFAQSMREQAAALSEAFGELQKFVTETDVMGNITFSGVEDSAASTARLIATVREELDTTDAAAARVVDALRGLSMAEGVAKQAEASAALAQAIAEAAGGADNLDQGMADLVRTLSATATAGYDAEAGIAAAGNAAASSVAQVRVAADAYREFAAMMSAAKSAETAARGGELVQKAVDVAGQHQPSIGRGGDPRLSGGSSWEIKALQLGDGRWFDPPEKAKKRAGGGGGGKSDAERDLERQREAREQVIEGLTREINLIGQSDLAQRIANETRRASVDVYSEQGQEIADLVIKAEGLRTEFERMTEVNEFAANSLADLFGSIASGSSSAKDAVADLLGQLGQLALNRAFMSLIGGSSFGGSAAGKLASAIFGIGVPSADGGGYTGDGARAGGMDGKGGFLAMLHPKETVVDHTRGQSSRTGLDIRVAADVDGNGNIVPYVRSVVQRERPGTVSAAVQATGQAMARNRRFGAPR